MDFNMNIIIEYWPFFLKGALLTLGISIAGIIIGAVIGLFISFGRMAPNKWIRIPFSLYINSLRGTPVLIQLFIVHYALLPAIYPPGTAVTSAIVTLSLNSSAYVAEIFRAGIQSLDKGQTEAARSLGMTKVQTMRYIIVPQAVRRMIPPLGNEFITLIKESSLAGIIAAEELMYWGKAAMGQYQRVWEPYIAVAIIYLVIVFSLTYLLQWIEKRWVQRD
ncbi:polar amino acid transport system permease protein [Salirhabdus euzebyi]|uniref:Polar amino acid transport system permease protein n=1 Tax=Salirhabdus euzebyi TaxID=394506 RepID=A0A841Q5Y7_9BACI|nr:amino acid ABC transporter permease [Salirhabdus euzebyi]MBB6453889.1 polar amino acid transport system permease protein [Salirhabdus euzebyi]